MRTRAGGEALATGRAVKPFFLPKERAKWGVVLASCKTYLRYLPSCCPQLNLIEGVWRRLKSFLMPRRYYNSLADPKEALLAALALVSAVNLQV